MNPPTISSLHPDEYSQELRYCPFAVNINRCFRSFNAVDDLSSRVCVPDKTEEICMFLIDNKNKQIKNINKTCIMQL